MPIDTKARFPGIGRQTRRLHAAARATVAPQHGVAPSGP